MDGGDVILLAQTIGNEGVGVLDAIDKVAAALNHALIDQLLEGFLGDAPAIVVQEFVPETAVDEVSRSMFRATHIEVHIAPVSVLFRGYKSLVVVGVHIAEVVGRTACKARHGVEFKGEDSLLVDEAVGNHTVMHGVPGPHIGMTQRGFTCFGRLEVLHLGQLQRQAFLRNEVGRTFFIIDGEGLTPVALAAEDGIAQTVVDLHLTNAFFADILFHSSNALLHAEAIKADVVVG